MTDVTEIIEVVGDRHRTPFAQTPEWVLLAAISDRAVRLYGILDRYAGANRQAYPTRQQIADKLGGVSVKSVDRALAELTAIGALTIVPQQSNGWRHRNLYRLHFDPPSQSVTSGQSSQTVTEPRRDTRVHLVGTQVSTPKGEPSKREPTASTPVSSSSPETYEDDHAAQPEPALVLVPYDEAQDAMEARMRALGDAELPQRAQFWLRITDRYTSREIAEKILIGLETDISPTPAEWPAYEKHYHDRARSFYTEKRRAAFEEAEREQVERRRALMDAWLDQATARIDAMRAEVSV